MTYMNDPILLLLAGLSLVCLYLALNPRLRPDMWLIVLGSALLILPRAGLVLENINLPLPVGHILVGLCILEWLVLRQGRLQKWSSYNGYFLAYAAVVGMGLAIGMASGGNYRTAFLEMCFYLFAIGLFFYVSETFTTRRHFHIFLNLFLLAGILVSVYGIAQEYLGSSILVEHVTYNSGSDSARSYVSNPELHRRVLSSYGDPNVLAGQLIFFVAIALALIVGKDISPGRRMTAVGVWLFGAACIYFTGSRAGLLCLILSGFLVFLWRTRWALIILPLLLILFLGFVPGMLESNLVARIDGIHTDTDIRAQFPRLTWEMLQAVPFGCGLGNAVRLEWQGFGFSFASHPTATLWSGFNSFWLNLFSRLGVPGLVAFALLFGALLSYIIRQVRQVDSPEVRAVLVGGVVALFCQALIWLFNNTYILPGGGLNCWFMMGMLVAASRAFRTPVPPWMASHPNPGTLQNHGPLPSLT